MRADTPALFRPVLIVVVCVALIGVTSAAAATAGTAAGGRHLVGSERVGPGSPAGALRSLTKYTSNNWAGYFATTASHGTAFTAVAASWIEPAVTCGSNQQKWAGFWVGMDGWWNDVVEQGGTEAHCINGVAHYNVWWEMYPFNAIQNGFAIGAGDKVHASVTYAAPNFTIVVKDITSGKTLTKLTPCRSGQAGCPRTSAEVISEDISHFSGGLFPLPDYHAAHYTNASVTNTNGHTGPLTDTAWDLGHVTELSGGVTKQTTSPTTGGGTSFGTTWQHA